ncbi:hypothetical protein DXG01_002278 [Tephrocybe rancida]|nr:hypothetical protein DXG01_002278 [Tephrocybe rancida]
MSCLGHVVNLGSTDVMSHITNIGNVETTTAIWEFDPSLPNNRVLGGSLDVISTIRTLTIKIQASGQRIEFFDKCQTQRGITDPLKIPLHSNVQWGSAYGMLDQAYQLHQAVSLFISSADKLFGPITTLQKNNHIMKHIDWVAFKLLDNNWARVIDTRDILADSNHIQQLFSSEEPTLWCAIPTLEGLLAAWEEKKKDPHFTIYVDTLDAGLNKIMKYYLLLNQKPSFVLAPLLHPYFKLNYIKMAWGGAKEQEAERCTGNTNAKNWQDKALKIVKNTNQCQLYPTLGCIALDIIPCQVSSVPCQQLFSASKQTADDCHAHLGAKTFEQLQIMKLAWCNNIMDLAALNSKHIEEVSLEQFEELLEMDYEYGEWDKEEIFVVNDDVDLF